MLNFDCGKYAYSSRRNVVFARKGMACSCVPLASQVGIDTMKRGGNAMDAAIAMAVTLPLVEPTCNGLGSDCFALIWSARDKKLYGLNGSGLAPMALSARRVREMGYTQMPINGWLPTMVPGAPAAWAALRRRFGRLTMAELMAPAMQYAREGYPVPLNVHKLWVGEAARFRAAAAKEPAVFAPWLAYFTKNGEAYGPGELFRLPDYADTLESLAATDCESYYRGELMEKIVAFSRETGGYFTEEDFKNYAPLWVEPITINYKGYDVFEMPPNGHGITALMALNILKGMELGPRDSAGTYHKMIEAMKLAFIDAKTYVADPRYMRTQVSDLLSDRYAARRRALIGETALYPTAGDPACGDTVYFCTADEEGNMVSFIQSNYMEFGSGVVIPGTAISLQNRGANFSLDEGSDNCLQGGKRSYHTIIPGFLARDGQPIGPFGVMGGFMQPQGHVQVVVNTVDYGMNPQDCLDAPRFQWQGGKKIQLEQAVPAAVAEELSRRGHEVEVVTDPIAMGRGQIIWRRSDGTLVGGTEPRSDGAIAVW
ncbi:MAG: gamma-glutamyltransferase family protein [Candidatus Limivicinus sp.]